MMIRKRILACFTAAALFWVGSIPAAASDVIANLYTGEISTAAWTCPVTLTVNDRQIYCPGNQIRLQCDATEAPYFVLSSSSGGETWAMAEPDGRCGNQFFYSYEAMASVFGTDFSKLDYISVMAAGQPITLYAIDMVKADTVETPEESQQPARVVGYLPDWSYQAYQTLDFSALTHLNLAFCNPDSNGTLSCNIPDAELKNLVEKAHANGVKVMAALGGGGGCDGYLPLLDTPAEMEALNQKIISFCAAYHLDGLDLDIELGSDHQIWTYYADWVKALRELCDQQDYQLSTATARWVAVNVTAETYELFDFVNVMAYDNEADLQSHASMAFAKASLNYFHVQRGIDKRRLVLGVPFYGRGYLSDGTMDWNSYVSFSELIAADPDNYEKDTYNGIAYNGAATLQEKCMLSKSYGGMMIWELSQDAPGAYSLLAVIKSALATPTGDVNGDGSLTIADVVLLQRYLLRLGTLAVPAAADLCSDGILDGFDLARMKQLLTAA